MKIFNVGNRIVNTYIYPIKNGYVVLDTGYENSYSNFTYRLSKCGIKPTEISYIFLTHAHDDHAGYLNELLIKLPHIQVISSDKALPTLLRGQNSFDGGCSSRLALFFCNFMKLLGKGEHKFPPIDPKFKSRFLIVTDETRVELEAILNGKIIFTSGHTSDSISLLLQSGIMFCGDAAMNGFPSLHKITIWVEDKKSFENSWNEIISLAPKKIYPAHGKPFEKSALEKNLCYVRKMKLYLLTSEKTMLTSL